MRSIEQSLDSIATALTALAAVHAGGATDAVPVIGTVEPAATRGKGRPAGSPNKPKPVEAAPTTAPEAETVAMLPVTAVSEAVTSTIKAGFREEVLATLAKYGAKNASGVKDVERAAFIAELDAVKAGADADPAG